MSLIDKFEQVTDALAEDIVNQAMKLDQAIGDRPFGYDKLPERAQVRRYNLVRNDTTAWQALLEQHGKGPTIDFARRMERLVTKYPEEML